MDGTDDIGNWYERSMGYIFRGTFRPENASSQGCVVKRTYHACMLVIQDLGTH